MRKNIRLFYPLSDNVTVAPYVVGIHKLAQRIIIELFTDAGSIKYQPERGTNFIARCKKAKTEFDIYVAFASAKTKIQQTLSNDENIRMPPDERLADFKLDEIIIGDDDSLTLIITIVSKARTTLQIDAPVIMLA